MSVADLTVVCCWSIFMVVWIVSARRVKAAAERQSRSSRRLALLPVASGALLLFVRSPALGNARWLPRTWSVGVAGAVLCLLGLAVALWSRRVIADNWSGDVTLKIGHELVRRGPYRWVRHPIYSGVLLMAVGSAVVAGRISGLVALALFLIAFAVKMRQEEALMLRVFPEQYAAYRAHTKALIPFVL
jgi:protein-S-isoprenylcysteine O-methyltransferase Ste14